MVDEKYTGLWEVDAEGRFLRNHFIYSTILPVVFGRLSNFQQLSDETVTIRDQIHNDIYHYYNGAVERYIYYDIKGNGLSEMIGTEVYEEAPRHLRAFTAQEKGNYIISLWIEEGSNRLFSLFSKKDKRVRYWDAFYSYDAVVP